MTPPGGESLRGLSTTKQGKTLAPSRDLPEESLGLAPILQAGVEELEDQGRVELEDPGTPSPTRRPPR